MLCAACRGPSSRRVLRRTRARLSTAAEPQFESVIGLEIHAQLKTSKKLFSRAATTFAAAPNSSVSQFDAALPGSLPVLNRQCVMAAVKAGLGVSGRIQLESRFVRKHYFYCDLPAGYQITQQDAPIVKDGHIKLSPNRTVHIDRIQLEQDSGKSVHDIDPSFTFVDLNRAGYPLIEIVTAPDMRSSGEASSFVRKIQSILRHLDVCDGIMAEGSLRCDVNVSIRPKGSSSFGERVEIKNLNSLKSLEKAINFERSRQIALFRQGKEVSRETRSFDSLARTTRRLRSKEQLLDYRIFPDPDLPLLRLPKALVADLSANLAELPDALAKRLQTSFGLTPYIASVLGEDPDAANYFERVISLPGRAGSEKAASNWIVNELFGKLKSSEIEIKSSPVEPERIRILVDLVESGEISGKVGKALMEAMMHGDKRDVGTIVDANSWRQLSDAAAIERLCSDVIEQFPAEVLDYGKGKRKKLNFLTSKVLAFSNGRANPQMVQNSLKKLLPSPVC